MSIEAKPPYVFFETRSIEDREKTLDAGVFVPKDVNYAIITPAGTKDRIEKVAEDWLRDLEVGIQQERFPAEWLQAYKARYKAWCETREIPEDGISVTTWPGITPAQVNILLDLNLRTVEQVAEATEEALGRIGMGARALKAKAQAFLDAADGTGKTAGELERLRQEVSDLKQRDAEREEHLKALRKETEDLRKAAEAKK